MAVNFLISSNSRFILVQEGRDLTLLRDGRLIWKKNIEYASFNVITVGDNGNAVVATDRGIVIYPQDPGISEKRLEGFDRDELKSRDSMLAKIVPDEKGTRLCIERVVYRSKVAEKIFKFLASSQAPEKGQIIHELLFYDLITGQEKIIYKFSMDKRIPNAFSWSISPNFMYLILGEAEKVFRGMETGFAVANLKADEVLDRFVLEGHSEWVLMINNEGSCLIDAPTKEDERELLASDTRCNKFKLTVPNEMAAEHIGVEYVAFRNRMSPVYTFKRYDNSKIVDVDLSSVEELEMDYRVIFDSNDDIIFVASRGGQVKAVHTNLESFPVDARRWRMMVEQQKIDTEISSRKEKLEEKQESLKEKKGKIRAEDLMKTIYSLKKARNQEKSEAINSKMNELKELKYSFMSNAISKYEYVKLKKKLENELEALQAKVSGEPKKETAQFPSESTAKFKQATVITPVSDKVPQLPPTLPSRQVVTEFPSESVEVNLTEALQKYIPTVVPEKEEKSSFSERIDIGAGEFKSGQDSTGSVDNDIVNFDIDIPMDDIKINLDISKADVKPIKARKIPEEEVQDATSQLGLNMDTRPRSVQDAEMKKNEDEETERMLEIKRQIEKEIQAAVTRKKPLGDSKKENLEKYEKLVRELEESFRLGGISESNYKRLRKKYEDRLKKIREEQN